MHYPSTSYSRAQKTDFLWAEERISHHSKRKCLTQRLNVGGLRSPGLFWTWVIIIISVRTYLIIHSSLLLGFNIRWLARCHLKFPPPLTLWAFYAGLRTLWLGMQVSAQMQPPYWSLWEDMFPVFGIPGIVTTSVCDENTAMATFLTQLLCPINTISKDNKELIRLGYCRKRI